MGQEKVTKKVLENVISLEMNEGHLKWKVTDLSRFSGVKREMIYYYFGKTKKEILARSFELIAEEFYGLGPEREAMVRAGGLRDSLAYTQKMFMENPAYGMFYLKWRTTPSPMQKQYMDIEKRYQARLKKLFPNLSAADIEALHALLHGIVTAPFLSEAGLNASAEWVMRGMKRDK